VWADTLQHAERLHLLRVCFWGGLSVLAGTGLLVLALVHRRASAIIVRFAIVCVVLGAVEIVVAAIAYRSVPLRDVSGATRLDRAAWLQLGLYVGLAAVGVTLMVTAFVSSRAAKGEDDRLFAFLGVGAATVLQGIALATLDLMLIADISR